MHDEDAYLRPPLYVGPPQERHACASRRFQGIPAVERAQNGRLWAAWYGGGVGEDHMNYILLATAEGGAGPWSPPVMVIDPDGEGPVRAFDPCLWHDPAGTLWLFWSQGYARHTESPRWGVWAVTTRDSGSTAPAWSAPVRLCDGILMNKPTVLSTGEWLLPVARWRREGSAGVVASEDGGRTWDWRGLATVSNPPDRNCDEHMLVERRDGSLWMLVRTSYGIGESVSPDRGRTWPPVTPSALAHTASRFFIRRLRSGRLLLVKHGNLAENTGRTLLKAFLSDDDGRTWSGNLLLDGRLAVSYPDGVEDEHGRQFVIYDFDRYDTKEIRLALFQEQDVLGGGTARTVCVNRAGGAMVRPRTPVRVGRSPAGPLLTNASAPGLRGNLNGPCLIRVPDWLPNPLGRYYLYFAHHKGQYIRLAAADSLAGPYRVYEPGVLDITATPFRGHIASPEVIVDHEARRIRMLYHGAGATEPNATGFPQVTACADSADGLRFVSGRRYLAESYLRVFRHDGWWIGFAGMALRRFYRSRSLDAPFEAGPVLEIEGEAFDPVKEYAEIDRIRRMRHVGLHARDGRLAIYYSCVGDAPERIKRTVVPLEGDWTGWRGGKVQEVIRPELEWEGANEPVVPSRGGARHQAVNELRDPHVFEEAGTVWLLYSAAGEQAIGLARIVEPEAV